MRTKSPTTGDLISSDRVELKESTSLHFGTYIATTLSAPSLYLRIGSDENEISYDRGFSSNAQWRRSSPVRTAVTN